MQLSGKWKTPWPYSMSHAYKPFSLQFFSCKYTVNHGWISPVLDTISPNETRPHQEIFILGIMCWFSSKL